MSPPPVKRIFPVRLPLRKIHKKKGLLLLSCGACGREARECGQRGGRRPGVVHGLSTRPGGRGPARRARPQIRRTFPDRATSEARALHSRQQPPLAAALPCRHIVLLPRCRDGVGAARGMLRAERRGFHGAPDPTARPSSYPVRSAGTRRPRDHDAQFGAVRRSGRRDPSSWTVPRSAANQAVARSHALPGFPGGPVGPPGCSGVQFPPLRLATGRRPPAPARRWRSATAPPAACVPAPRSPASGSARRGR